MGIISQLFGRLEADHRGALADAVRPKSRPRNSYESNKPSIGRILASERRIATRNMDELIGMCRMVLADGHVDDTEARFLLNWIENTFHAKDVLERLPTQPASRLEELLPHRWSRTS